MSNMYMIALVVVLSVCLWLGAYYYQQLIALKQKIIFLSRMGDVNKKSEIDVGIKVDRLSHDKHIQEMLRNVPVVHALARLLDRSGLALTVVALLQQMVITCLTVWIGMMAIGLKIISSLFFAVLFGMIPYGRIVYICNKRAKAFEMQLPQAFESMALYLRTGRSIPQAFIATTDELPPPASEEFKRCVEEYHMGVTLETSMRRLALKYPKSIGFRLFVIAVSVLGQTGGNVIEILERIKKILNAGITFQLRLKSLTGEARVSACILGSIPGVFMLAITWMNPKYLDVFFDTSQGLFFLGVILVLWIAGILWIIKLMKSQVF